MLTIESAAELLCKGKIIIFPTDTVYGIGALSSFPDAVERIYAIKKRCSTKPLIALTSHLPPNMSKEFYTLAERFWPGSLTLIISPKMGFRMPDHPITLGILNLVKEPILTTSANLSGQPSPTTPDTISIQADGQLLSGPLPAGLPSTVYDLQTHTLLRPGPISLCEIKNCLAGQ